MNCIISGVSMSYNSTNLYTLHIGMMQINYPSLSPNTIYRLATPCAMGLDCCGVGTMFTYTCSLLCVFTLSHLL